MEIIAKNICKTVDKNNILNNINIHIKSGSIYGLIGPNGAGKTTFTRLLFNIYTPTSGKITIDGVNVQDENFEKIKPNIACVMDNLGLYKNLTVSENVEFFHRIYFPKAKSTERKRDITRSLDFFGLHKKLNDRIIFLSKGERQRLALARACINDPKLLVLDEPTNGLDVEGVLLVRRYLQKMKERGATVLITSHNLSELEKICDYYGFINEGTMVEQGSYEELVEKYKSSIKSENIELEDIYKVIFDVE